MLERYKDQLKDSMSQEISMMPIMSLLVLLIPFLLITTVFIETAVFDIYLPKVKKVADNNIPLNMKKTKKDPLLVLLTEKGIKVGKSNELSGFTDMINAKKIIERLRREYGSRSDIVLASDPGIKYEKLIKVMDILAENGFTDISLKASENSGRI